MGFVYSEPEAPKDVAVRLWSVEEPHNRLLVIRHPLCEGLGRLLCGGQFCPEPSHFWRVLLRRALAVIRISATLG